MRPLSADGPEPRADCQFLTRSPVKQSVKRISILLVVFAAFALPGVALGQGAGSGADEYSEDIPGGGGNQPSNENNGGSGGSGGGSTGSGGTPLPSGTQGELEAQGGDGAAAANLAQSTGPKGERGANGANDANGGGAGAGGTATSPDGEVAVSPGSDSSGSGVGEVVGELAGGSEDGMGILLPIILGSVLVAAVAFVLIRRSGGSAGSA